MKTFAFHLVRRESKSFISFLQRYSGSTVPLLRDGTTGTIGIPPKPFAFRSAHAYSKLSSRDVIHRGPVLHAIIGLLVMSAWIAFRRRFVFHKIKYRF
jgi:hypothetical protein